MSEKIWQEFYCNDCCGYFRVRLNVAINCSVEMTCPKCGRKHPRRIENGRIYEGGGGSTKEEIRPPKSAYSKKPFSKKIRANEREGVVLDSEKIGNNILRESWLDRHGG